MEANVGGKGRTGGGHEFNRSTKWKNIKLEFVCAEKKKILLETLLPYTIHYITMLLYWWYITRHGYRRDNITSRNIKRNVFLYF